MNKKKVVKISLLIILIILLLFIVHTVRNFVIIKGLQTNIEQYMSSTNFHMKSVEKQDSNTIVTMNYYEKDEKQAVFLERNADGETTKISMYNNGERIDTFYDNSEGKTVQINQLAMISVNVYSCLETDSNWQTILASVMARVKKVDYNGKECYIVNNFKGPLFLSGTKKNEVYIEKDTGLFVKSIMDSFVTEKEYEFENVKDEIFVEPDIGQYKIQENI